MSESSALALAGNTTTALGFADAASLDHLHRVATMFSKSQLVPVIFQNNPSNVMIALEMSQRMGCSAMMLMQNMNIIHNKPSFAAQFLTALVNSSRRFSPLRYLWEGTEGNDNWSCRCRAKSKEDNEECLGTRISISIAKKEGWYDKPGSKWKTIPELMLQYRAATWWARMYASDLLNGMPTEDEVYDITNLELLPPGGTPGAVAEPMMQTRRRSNKGVVGAGAEMKRAEPVPVEPTPAAEPAATLPPEAPGSDLNALFAPEAAPVPAEQQQEEQQPPAEPTVDEKRTALRAEEKTGRGKDFFRCTIEEVVEIPAKTSAGPRPVCKIELSGDYVGLTYFDGPRSKVPMTDTLIDVVMTEKMNGNVLAKIISKLEVVA